MSRIRTLLIAAALPLLATPLASAHMTYSAARDFGVFSLSNPKSVTLAPTNSKSFGWADGTDADWAAQDNGRYLNFRLLDPMTLTITVQSADVVNFLPAFSIYMGVSNQAASTYAGVSTGMTGYPGPDYDGAPDTQTYLTGTGSPTKEGVGNTLGDFKIANDAGTLRSFTYMGNAADGTAANYGNAAGINGDGVADGYVSKTFTLPAGDYTLLVSGAKYADQANATNYNFTPTLSTVPEPSSALLLAGGAAALGFWRRRRVGAFAA